jgi:hypothetical protein
MPAVVDLTGKTKAQTQNYNIGYINTTDTASLERRVSEMFANVEWLETPAPVGGLKGNYLFTQS